MARKGKSTEEIIVILREAEIRPAQGETAGKICRGAGISEQTYYKWRREYGGLKIDQAKRLKELERENERLKKAVSELTLDKQILKESPVGKILSPSRKRACVDHVRSQLAVSERRACRPAAPATPRPRPLEGSSKLKGGCRTAPRPPQG